MNPCQPRVYNYVLRFRNARCFAVPVTPLVHTDFKASKLNILQLLHTVPVLGQPWLGAPVRSIARGGVIYREGPAAVIVLGGAYTTDRNILWPRYTGTDEQNKSNQHFVNTRSPFMRRAYSTQ